VLAEEIVKPGIEAVVMFRAVQRRVRADIRQEPYLGFSALGEVYLAGRDARPPEQPPTQARLSEAAEAWDRTKDTTNVGVLEAFMARFKNTFLAELARARVDELKKQQIAAVTQPELRQPAPPANLAEAETTRKEVQRLREAEEARRREEETNRDAEAQEARRKIEDEESRRKAAAETEGTRKNEQVAVAEEEKKKKDETDEQWRLAAYEPLRLLAHFYIAPHCKRAPPPEITITKKPAHGRIEFRTEVLAFRRPSHFVGSSADVCIGTKQNFRVSYYVPSDGPVLEDGYSYTERSRAGTVYGDCKVRPVARTKECMVRSPGTKPRKIIP
jgi:hypothetical protein